MDLSHNALKSCVVKYFLESLLDNVCLMNLNLSGNFLDDDFARDLSLVLENNPILNTVDISKNPISPSGAKLILNSLL